MSAPALVTADALSKAAVGRHWPRAFSPEYFDKLVATLRHYEAEVGRLGAELERAMERYEEQLAREAPFAALGRDIAKRAARTAGHGFIGVDTFDRLVKAARAALAEESEPEWSEPAPSGTRYKMRGDNLWSRTADDEGWAPTISVEDAAFVARLTEKNDE